MMDDEYRVKLNIPNEHVFQLIHSESTKKKGQDNDDFTYEERNASGVAIATYHIWHHMSVYPPFSASHGYKKYSTDGKLLDEGRLS